jgi:hypothetical protein
MKKWDIYFYLLCFIYWYCFCYITLNGKMIGEWWIVKDLKEVLMAVEVLLQCLFGGTAESHENRYRWYIGHSLNQALGEYKPGVLHVILQTPLPWDRNFCVCTTFFLFSGCWWDCLYVIVAAKELIVPLPDEGQMNMEDWWNDKWQENGRTQNYCVLDEVMLSLCTSWSCGEFRVIFHTFLRCQ